MSYTKTNWQSGDVISAEKLNKMEDGITSAYTTATSAEVKADSLAETIIDFNNLETVEELGENDKVIINSGGEIKQVDGTNIRGGSTVNIFSFNLTSEDGEHILLDKTWQEIKDAVDSGAFCVAQYRPNYAGLSNYVEIWYLGYIGFNDDSSEYFIDVKKADGSHSERFTAVAPSDYPASLWL